MPRKVSTRWVVEVRRESGQPFRPLGPARDTRAEAKQRADYLATQFPKWRFRVEPYRDDVAERQARRGLGSAPA